LHVVSIFPRPILFLLVLTVARATSPEQSCRPLPAPAVVEAQVSTLTLLSCARVASRLANSGKIGNTNCG
jgi:hypothetical protein